MDNASCPICLSTNIKSFLQTKDFSLTNESFTLQQCLQCSLVFTDKAPTKELIGPYYAFKAYISHTNDNEGVINSIYQQVRKITLAQKTSWIQSLLPSTKGHLLDIGAGIGAFANAMSKKGWIVEGLEPDASTRKRAKELFNLDLKEPNQLFELPEQSIDIITLWHVLEHVHELHAYLKVIDKILKQNGKLVIAVPNYTSFDAQYYTSYWAAYDVPRHLYHFSPKSMMQLLDQYNFEIVKYKPMWFDAFYVALLSEKYKKSGILGIVRAILIGLLSNFKALFNTQFTSSVIYEVRKK